MIWFSASCSFTILPNSFGLPALPLRITSVEGSNRLRSLPSLACVAAEDACPGLSHHLLDAQCHLIEFLAQALQHKLLQDVLRMLHTSLDLFGEALCLSHDPACCIQQPAIALLQLVLIDRAFGARDAPDLQQPQLHAPAPVTQFGP